MTVPVVITLVLLQVVLLVGTFFFGRNIGRAERSVERVLSDVFADDATMIIPAVRPSGALPIPAFAKPEPILYVPQTHGAAQACVGPRCAHPQLHPGQAVWWIPNPQGGHWLSCLDCARVETDQMSAVRS
jgi:hypothetical protein